MLALTALAVGSSPALADTDNDRPIVHSVYARDEGSAIRLRVTYCDNTAPFVARYRHIFRIFDGYGDVVARRTTTRTGYLRCVDRGFA